jgi:hypothetical protein
MLTKIKGKAIRNVAHLGQVEGGEIRSPRQGKRGPLVQENPKQTKKGIH